MSQTVQRPPTSTEQGGFNGAGKPPLEPQKKPVFPNWGITAIATIYPGKPLARRCRLFTTTWRKTKLINDCSIDNQ